MKQFQSNANDILARMKHIDEFCDVTLVSEEGESILAHKIVLASSSTIFRKILKNYDEKNEDQVISMRGVQSKFINAMVDLIYNGETEVKLTECEEFMNILREYKVASEEFISKYKEDTTSNTKYEEKDKDNKDDNVIKQHEDEIKRQKEDILKFQTTFTMMKQEIYSLRAENKELKDTKSESTQYSEKIVAAKETEKKESETQTESTLRAADSEKRYYLHMEK